MSKEKDDIKKIQNSIEDILGTESGLAKKRPTVKDKKRELFNTIVTGLAHINGRSLSLKHDYKIDFIEYDDIFLVQVTSPYAPSCISVAKDSSETVDVFLL